VSVHTLTKNVWSTTEASRSLAAFACATSDAGTSTRSVTLHGVSNGSAFIAAAADAGVSAIAARIERARRAHTPESVFSATASSWLECC
jgi:hypothetical protein